jgi:hypothetical protein
MNKSHMIGFVFVAVIAYFAGAKFPAMAQKVLAKI